MLYVTMQDLKLLGADFSDSYMCRLLQAHSSVVRGGRLHNLYNAENIKNALNKKLQNLLNKNNPNMHIYGVALQKANSILNAIKHLEEQKKDIQ